MSDMDLENSGLQEVANAMREEAAGVNHQKRRRDSESADDHRRHNKRVSPNMNKSNDPHQQDLEALQDYGALHHGNPDQNGAADHASASSTAAAALAGIYPTMTIPQPTDVSFATQNSDPDRVPDSSFMDNSQQGGDSFMESSTPSGRASGSKPAVGSDEWHKVRKDNHKEGKSLFIMSAQIIQLTISQSSVVVERRSMRVSTSWRRLSLVARRTRDQSCSALSSSSLSSRRTRPRTSRSGR